MPGPVSVTRIVTRRASGEWLPVTVTVPPAGVWRRAFATRFVRTSRIRTGSTSRIGRSSVVASVSVTPAAVAAAPNERTTSAMTRSTAVGSRWSARVPASDRVSVRRSSMSRAITWVWSRIGARCASSAG